MLEHNAEAFCRISCMMGQMIVLFENGVAADTKQIGGTLGELQREVERMQLHGLSKHMERIKKHFLSGEANTSTMHQHVVELYNRMRDDLESELFVMISHSNKRYYEQTEPLFGEAVNVAFPTASLEIADAGKCRAFGRWTACVMHLMRALETPMNALAKRYDVKPGQNWNTALNEIDAALKSVTKSTVGPDAEQWASEASAHLRLIKNAWRNHAQHGNARYDEEQAVAIWGNVDSFMRTLASGQNLTFGARV
jgi:hypothetical protein